MAIGDDADRLIGVARGEHAQALLGQYLDKDIAHRGVVFDDQDREVLCHARLTPDLVIHSGPDLTMWRSVSSSVQFGFPISGEVPPSSRAPPKRELSPRRADASAKADRESPPVADAAAALLPCVAAPALRGRHPRPARRGGRWRDRDVAGAMGRPIVAA